MTEGSIEFACPYCERITRVPAAYGGKQGKCPGCQKVIEVPNPSAEAPPTTTEAPVALEATLLEPPPVPADGSAGTEPTVVEAIGTPVTAPPATWKPQGSAPAPRTPLGVMAASVATAAADSGGVTGPERPCPSCGEQIKSAAKKCKFCGEFLDERLRAQRRGPAPAIPVGKLASPWTRFAAFLLDSALLYIPMAMLIGLGFVISEQTRTEAFAIAGGLLGTFYYFVFCGYSWYLLATRGQNIPKRWLGIKIVKIDGNPVDFVSAVLLRNWVMFFVAVFVPCYLGHLANLVGYLVIFSDDRRCLHDHIASTVVVEV